MENKFDVKETVETGLVSPSFIQAQGVDTEAAFQRMTITKDMLGQYQAAINSTNTADIVGTHKALFDKLESVMKEIINEEMILIAMGK